MANPLGFMLADPYTDHAPTGPDYLFSDADVEVFVDTLHHIKQTAVSGEVT